MAVIYPSYDRAILENDGDKLRITIPVARMAFATIFLSIFLILIAYSEIHGFIVLWNGSPPDGVRMSVEGEVISKGPDFTRLMIRWLAGWTIVSVLFAGLSLWYFFGREIIELDATTLRRIRKIPLLHFTKKYPVANISNLRQGSDFWLPSWLPAQRVSFMTFRGGRIAFDCGRHTRRLGLELSDNDTRRIMEEMCKKVPSLCR
ncbi:hypothetical protein [Taklimakanibacter lacteus]|uniref:hypothetical protein n=1 Tax=Taklimakanibacter lacteus TaxID=2268456 RepID=UPI000E66C2F8